MTKTQIQEALVFAGERIKTLTDGIVKHHSNPFISKIAEDVRFWEKEQERLRALDGDTYPALDEIEAAPQKQLMIWYRSLRKPVNNEEVFMLRRMSERMLEFNHLSIKNK